MTAPRPPASAVLVLVALVAAALLVGGGVSAWLWGEYRAAVARIERIDAIVARLRGLGDASEQIAAALKDAEAQRRAWAYVDAGDAGAVGNLLQQAVRGLLEASGIAVGVSEVQGARPSGDLDLIEVSFRGEGSAAGLQKALIALQARRPVIVVRSLGLRPVGRVAADGQPLLAVTLSVAAYRVKTP